MSIKFSIIIPTYNRAHLISKAIESVIDQTYPNWELVIVDDGSTDNTEKVVKSYKDDRIKYFWQENQERSVARNNGIKKSNGSWICFLDSDDWYELSYLEILNNEIPCKEHLIRTNIHFVDESNHVIAYSPSYTEGENQQRFVAETNGSLLHFAIKREVFKEFQFYNIPPWEDKDLLIRILNKYSFKPINFHSVNTLNHKSRSILFTHKSASAVNSIIKRMNETLEKAIHLNRKDRNHVVKKWISSSVYNSVNDPKSNTIKFMKEIKAIGPEYLLRYFYYSFKRLINDRLRRS